MYRQLRLASKHVNTVCLQHITTHMKNFLLLLSVLFGLWASPALAEEPQTVGQVKLELLKNLQTDGYLSDKLAQEAREKYITPEDVQALPAPGSVKAEEPSFLDRHLSWSSFFKVLAIGLFLVAFGQLLVQLASAAYELIVAVPKGVYQTAFLGTAGFGLAFPEKIWASQAFYVALFCAFAAPMVVSWVIESHPKFKAALKKLFNLGIPPASVASAWLMVYFGALALHYQSEILGFAAAVALSGVLSFGMYYRPGLLVLDFKEKALPAVVLAHLAILGTYAVLVATQALPPEAKYFSVGLEFYCTIAMGVGFLVGASPFQRRSGAGYLALFVGVLMAGVYGYFFYDDLKVIGSILCVIAVLLALEWGGYLCSKAGFILGAVLLGAALYGLSLGLEAYGHLLILRVA